MAMTEKIWSLEYNIYVFFANSQSLLAHGSWGNGASQVFQRSEPQGHFKSTSLGSQQPGTQQRPLQQCTLEFSLQGKWYKERPNQCV